MAQRPPKNPMAAKDLERHLAKLVKRRPGFTPKDVELYAWSEHGVRMSDETFRRCFIGLTDPSTCNIEVLWMLRNFFDVEDEALGHHAAERLRKAMVMASGGPGGASQQGSPASGWTSPTNISAPVVRHLHAVGL